MLNIERRFSGSSSEPFDCRQGTGAGRTGYPLQRALHRGGNGGRIEGEGGRVAADVLVVTHGDGKHVYVLELDALKPLVHGVHARVLLLRNAVVLVLPLFH